MSNLKVVRATKKHNFIVMNTKHLRDKNISLVAKGLMCYILAEPPEWDFSLNGLIFGFKENASLVELALTELIEHGYLKEVH